jgi:hypothetical protein
MESVRDLVAVIRLQGQLPTAEGLRIDVAVDGTRKAYGRTDYRVSTLAGEACVSVANHCVELESKV